MTRLQRLLRATFIVLLFSVALLLGSHVLKSKTSSKLILEVINSHFTVGRKIRSTYLRVFSDGRVECHTIKYWNEADSVKKSTLSAQELQELKAELNNPELSQIKTTYGLVYPVVDSWMEWNIKIPRGWGYKEITVRNFSPVGARKGNQPYPDALVKLGCDIWKLRKQVYGDESYFGNDECKEVLAIH